MKKLIRNHLSHHSDYTFKASNDFTLDPTKQYGLYLHIPFCKNKCPYCPYYKTTYNKTKVQPFLEALQKEITITKRYLKEQPVTSLYIGGGTPTLLDEKLIDIIKNLQQHFNIKEEIAIETSPADLTDKKLTDLQNIGVNSLSIGIQSLKDESLKTIGRTYTTTKAHQSLQQLSNADFGTINIDMMFALPRQSLNDLKEDLKDLLTYQPQQITYYPLFTFPYTTVGAYKKLTKTKMPNFATRRKMYTIISRTLKKAGYHQSSVWSFQNTHTNKFSSVTRDYYIGLGPSAATYTGQHFFFNTFDFTDYLKTKEKKPIILKMDVNKDMEKLFWLYWRFYETTIPTHEYKRLFHSTLEKDFSSILLFLRAFRFIEKEDKNTIQLNHRGIFYTHLLQNHYALDYINTIWANCQHQKTPEEIRL